VVRLCANLLDGLISGVPIFVLMWGVDVEAINSLLKDLKGGLTGLLETVLKEESPGADRPEPPYTNRFTCICRSIPTASALRSLQPFAQSL
jgi:hypothetical protein